MTRRRLFDVLFMGLVLAALAPLIWVEFWRGRERDDREPSLVEPGLYMGGSVAAPPAGTTAVLNLCEIEDPYECEVQVWERIRDGAPAPSVAWLRKQVEFVDAQRRADRTVYVHCAAGVSRAGMVVAAYLMFKNGWSRDQALEFVRSQRPIVRPNRAFMELLLEWERELTRSARSAADW